MVRRLLAFGVALSLGAAPALAQGTKFPPITDKTTLTECSACHLAFPPQLLPARSWQALLGNLGSHFGQSATLAAQDQATVLAYLKAHAGDAPGTPGGATYLKGLQASTTPLRITETPYWKRWHGEVSKARFAQVKSPANCEACHKGAAKGQFTEAEEEE